MTMSLPPQPADTDAGADRARARWRRTLDRLVAQFLTGLLILAPLIVTLMVLDWLVRQVAAIFGPKTLLGSALTSGGAFIFGEGGAGFWILLVLVVLLIWTIGFVLQDRARRSIERRLDALAGRIPVIRHIYRPVAQVVRVLGKRDNNQFAAMRPVSVRFGSDTETLALQVSADTYRVGSRDLLLILIPTAPVPVGGALLFMAPEAVTPVEGMGVEELMSFYVSMGTMAGRFKQQTATLPTA
jgi:uncharacterized membrane protein